MLRIHNDCGSVAIEFTLVILLFLIFVGAIIEWGQYFAAAHLLEESARQGARAAVVKPDLSDLNAEAALIRSQVMEFGCLSGINVQVSGPQDLADDYTPQEMVTVTITANCRFILFGLVGMSSLPIVRRSIMRYEWQGLDPPAP